MFERLKIIYYRFAAWHGAWRESARDAYIARAVATHAVRVLLTAEGIAVTWPDPTAGDDGLTLAFVVRVSALRFPAGDDRLFVETLFAPAAIRLRVDGRPAEVVAVELEQISRERHDNYWAVSITAVASGAPPGAGSEVVLEAGNVAATFVLGRPSDETGPLQAPGVREFVRQLKPGDFDEP